MIDRRRAVRLALATLPGAYLLRSAAARADQAFQRFLPLAVDLDGWKDNKPDGMTMEIADNSMTTAKRDYTRGAAQLHALGRDRPSSRRRVGGDKNQDERRTSEGHMLSRR